ncbi:HypC/HybG/HupF family hydrogenase formation chaperone [Streptomyces sp. NPDC048415]|jgi:hydrogenase expression/formation protein HypC|uniref:HypC/HybG/HupF family hydrogenase formation chaperone n=1 Tax=Streptomyces sp. NPDC048415 TaxID=3154822 RepID=UPI00342E0963
MCLAVPGRVLAIEEHDESLTGLIDFGGVHKRVCLDYVSDVQVGEYVIVHVGFALQRLDEESAQASLRLFEELGLLEEEFGDPWGRASAEAGLPGPGEPREADMPAAAPRGQGAEEGSR